MFWKRKSYSKYENWKECRQVGKNFSSVQYTNKKKRKDYLWAMVLLDVVSNGSAGYSVQDCGYNH